MMFWYDHNMSGWGAAGMGIGMVLFWILIVVGIVALIRAVTANNAPAATPTTPRVPPEQLLAERFARGEIDDTEYRQRLAALRDHTTR